MPQRSEFHLGLTLRRGLESEAARQCLALSSEQEWASLVALSVAVLSLEEKVANQVTVFRPGDQLPQTVEASQVPALIRDGDAEPE